MGESSILKEIARSVIGCGTAFAFEPAISIRRYKFDH